MQIDTTECCCWQNQNIIRTWNILVHAVECKWIQQSLARPGCCCEPTKMNIAAIELLYARSVCVGNKDLRLT